ncbi:tuberin [Biomphalaria pfeifferi]|uniref:Tuberin n=1 Tax=Biomphalaria pfeifferi TaxID=112525 RepID=A0AAD8B733_BIOPF|nr:tuberin [Biomphalaria pfeifferi]
MSGIGKQTHKGEENFKEKMQKFFFKRTSAPHNVSKTITKEIIFTPEILKEIGPESPANNRIRTIKELCEVVKHKQLEDNAVEAMWLQIRDLLHTSNDPDNRQLALYFLQCLLEGQLQYMSILRAHFFSVIQSLTDASDIYNRLELFKTLSEQGKNLLYFEDKVGSFLLDWMPDVVSAGYVASFLPIILNVIKYNAAYLDEDVMSGLVQQTCMIPNRTRSEEELTKCLQVLDAVVCYSYLPSNSLYHFVAALCHTVDKKEYSEKSWELMKKLLGTYLGHSAICTMCSILQNKSQPVDVLLLRGAIFFTGMALWGSRRVTTLKHTFTSVLPSFLQAMTHENSIVAYEVVLNIQRLVHKYGKDLNYITWEIVLDIVQTLLNQIDRCGFEKKVATETHQVITTIETLNSSRQFFGPADRLFKIVEQCANSRPTSSVCGLIDYYHNQFIQPKKENWIEIETLHSLMEKYFKCQTRTEIRKKTLDVLSCVLSVNTHILEKELIEYVVIPHFIHIGSDPDTEVRCKAVELLISLCEHCQMNEFFDLMLIIENILKKPLLGALPDGEKKEETLATFDEGHLLDVQTAVEKICDLFKIKLYQAPASHSHRLYEILISHLELHYSHLYLSKTACGIRKTIFSLLLLLRADSHTRVGLADRKPGERHVFSPYLMCQPSDDLDVLGLKSPTVPGLSASQIYAVIEYEHTFKLFLSCLEKEKDWLILQSVLDNLPLILENKTLVLSGDKGLIDALCGKLCAMVKDRTLDQSQKLINRPASFTRSDFHTFVFPVLASIVTYHTYLDKHRLKELVNCLEFGLVSKCAKVCVTTLRICSLEMKELMMRMLPAVLLSLSKISATISMAIPVLAFLSSIVRIPELYANFVEDQYMSVFAIALPYTNPFKFSHYTVSLAHHVIGIWFIRCRLPFRRGFVKYIQRGLKYNVLQLFEENSIRHLSSYNQDSSDRSRTCSLNEGHRRRRNMTGIEGIRNDGRIPMDEKMSQFHKELTETCVDMMSRYAFGNFSALPVRTPVAQFLLKDGQSGMWVVGNKIITVTTSGGGGKSGNSGLCDNCLAVFQNSQRELTGGAKSSNVATVTSGTRRRHKSMASLGRSQTQIDSLGISLETDESLHPRRCRDDMSLPQDSHDMYGRDDAAVQTGSSLNKEGMDSLITENKNLVSEIRTFSATQCSCWCTSWAEVNIRGASGVVSWMMRIENESSGYSFYSDPSLPDITQLLAPVRCKTPDSDSIGKIDSGSLCEEDYETLHCQHFSGTDKTLVLGENESQTQTSSQEAYSTFGQSETSFHSVLRRTSSSPTFPSGSLSQEPNLKHSGPDKESILGTTVKSLDTHGSKNRPEAVDFSQTEFDSAPIMSAIKKISEAVERKSDLSLKLSMNENKQMNTSEPNLSQKSFESNDSVFQPTSAPAVKRDGFDPAPFRGRAETSSGELRRSITGYLDGRRPAHRSLSMDLEGKKRPDNLQLLTNHNKDTSQASPTEGSNSSSLQDEVPEMRQLKRRGHTISVIHSASDLRRTEDVDSRSQGPSSFKDSKVGLNPSYVFLQLYHSHPLVQSQEVPLKVPETEKFRRTVDILDHIYPYETHKIGVLYMGKGQPSDEKVLLSNEYGSPRYIKFLLGLGDMISIEEAEKEKVYLGGLTSNDGKFTVTWQDECLRVIYHIATLMPNRQGDTRFTNKKSHIGNDFVTIVYNDSSEDYKSGTITGQFNFVSIIIRPLDYESNAVTLLTKEGLGAMKDIADILGHTHTKIISDLNLPLLVRQIAINCNLASMVLQRQQSTVGSPEVFASNWLERLRQIKLLKQRILEHQPEESSTEQPASPSHMWPPTGASGDTVGGAYEDFTDYL